MPLTSLLESCADPRLARDSLVTTAACREQKKNRHSRRRVGDDRRSSLGRGAKTRVGETRETTHFTCPGRQECCNRGLWRQLKYAFVFIVQGGAARSILMAPPAGHMRAGRRQFQYWITEALALCCANVHRRCKSNPP